MSLDESSLEVIIAITKHSAPGLVMAILRAALDIRVIKSNSGLGDVGWAFSRIGRQWD